MIRALVLRAPGINRDGDAAHACRLAGFATDLVHINQLSKTPDALLNYHFLLIPGGFSYGDDLGAGNLLAKNLTIHLGEPLRQFIEEGRPVLGICNGFQVLVRAGLLPGLNPDPAVSSTLRATLTDNQSAQFECRWVTMAVPPSTSIFTRGIERPLESPIAHGEGQFVFAGDISQLQASGQIALVYARWDDPRKVTHIGGPHTDQSISSEVPYPANPNGSLGNIAGICNLRGNVMGLMPHPEDYVHALQHPSRRANAQGEGDGLLIFKNAYTYARQFEHKWSVVGTNIAHTPPITPLHGYPQEARVFMGDEHIVTSPLPALNIPTPLPSYRDTGPLRQEVEPETISYATSGVDIAAGEQAVRLMQQAVKATHGPEVLAGVGAFAGVFSAQALHKMRQPALVASTDGVGTKTLLAAQARRFDTIGYDIVNHCVNDLLMQGGKPLFFMDYIATSKLDPEAVATVVKGVAEACQQVGCALLGGETAEMPDVYQPGAFDLAGTIVGVVEQDEMPQNSTISVGDLILGLPSSGLHTNGYSLARRVFAPYALNTIFPELDEPLIDALLRPHRCYLREITQLRSYLSDRSRFIKGMAHITGGGFDGNISRILPTGKQALIETDAWEVPPLFQLIARLGKLERAELYRAFNMGIGMVIILSPKVALEARCILPELLTIGHVREGEGVVLQ